jgi:hypothetical protein
MKLINVIFMSNLLYLFVAYISVKEMLVFLILHGPMINVIKQLLY